MDHHQVVHLVRSSTVIRIVGNFIKRIITNNKSLEEFPFHPYIYLAGIFNCCLWVLYGAPAVHPGTTLLRTINSAGLVLYTLYLTLFLRYAPMKKKLHVLAGIAVAAAVTAATSVSILLLVHPTAAKMFMTVVGIILGVVVGAGVYEAAPRRTVEKVVEATSKSVEYYEFFPVWVCLGGLATGIIVVWTSTTYSQLGNGFWAILLDINILVGNGLGSIFGFFQMGRASLSGCEWKPAATVGRLSSV